MCYATTFHCENCSFLADPEVHLTGAKAVGADGPLGVIGADVALLPLLLGQQGIRQRRAFVLRPERMEDQTWDAAAGASFLG